MGLAASQARFLGLTMRKADCEYRSTMLAQQKLEITNQMSQIAQDYSNGMNATRLVWSNDAVGADINLSYSLLMMPSVANDYNPYFPTTTSGAVVLNSSYAAAAKAAGITMAGGVASEDGRDKFLAALVGKGIVTKETANAIQKVDYSVNKDGAIETPSSSDGKAVAWNAMSGLGAAPKDKSSGSTMTLSDMILSPNFGGRVVNLLAGRNPYKSKEDGDGGMTTGWKDEYQGKTYISSEAYNQIRDEGERSNYYVDDSYIKKIFNTTDSSNLNSALMNFVVNGNILTDTKSLTSMSLGDIMANDVVIMGGQNDQFIKDVTAIFENIAGIFGYNKEIGTGLYVDDASYEALQNAVAMTEAHFLRSGNAVKIGDTVKNSNPSQCSAYQNAIENNRLGADTTEGGYYAVSLSNLISTFLTYYDNELRGPESPFFAGKSLENESTYMITENRNYQYIVGKSSDNVISSEVKVADFYDELYNNICAHGWREDSAIDDNEYFQNSIKNGRYSLTSLNADGYFYQTRYNDTGYLVEEVDKDAVARAEAEYSRKKAELTYKEDAIDLRNKNLDAEISELSTEIDSVKNMISKSVEKTFTMFSQ